MSDMIPRLQQNTPIILMEDIITEEDIPEYNTYNMQDVIIDEYIPDKHMPEMNNSVSISLDNNDKMVYYSNFFEVSDETPHIDHIMTYKSFFLELVIIIFLSFFAMSNSLLSNAITIDGLISCIVFLGNTYNLSVINIQRLPLFDRYIYYVLLYIAHNILCYILWIGTMPVYLCNILFLPCIMFQVNNIESFRKIKRVIYDKLNDLIKKIVCKQLSKIINIVIFSLLGECEVKYQDLIPFYDNFSWMIISRFIATFILACIFNHIDKGSMRVPMMIYKNLYMKDNNYSINDDKMYLSKLITDKKWGHFMEIYTLNRIIRMIINDEGNTVMSEQVSKFFDNMIFRINKVLFCWTIMGVSGLTYGILSFLIFIRDDPIKYILNTLIFVMISVRNYTDERLLVLVICEMCYSLIRSKLLLDIITDTYTLIRSSNIRKYISYRSLALSLLISLIMSLISLYLKPLWMSLLFLAFPWKYKSLIIIMLIGSLSGYNFLHMILMPFFVDNITHIFLQE